MKKTEKREKRVVNAQRRMAEHKTGFERTSLNLPEGATMFTLDKAGVYRLDIIPYEVGEGNPFADEGDLYFERTYWTHRGIGPDNATYVCPAKTFKKPCPICEHQQELKRDPDSDEDLVKSLYPKERQLWNVIDHAEKSKGVQVWDISHHLFGKHLDAKIRDADEDDGYTNFSDLENGMVVKIGATEKNFAGVKFYECSNIDFKSRSEPYDESILKESYCLDEMPKEVSADELKKVFLQVAEKEEDEEADEKKEVRSKGKPIHKRKAEEDEDEDLDEEDSELEEKPSKNGKKPAPKAKTTEEEDEEESDDDSEVEDGDSDEVEIEVGASVEHDDFGVCKILKISSDGTSLTLEDKKGKVHKAISPTDVVLVEAEEADEDEDEPKPAKAGKKPTRKVVDEDEEDEEDIELEEEDEDDSEIEEPSDTDDDD